MFVLVTVLGDDDVGIELDRAERDALGLDRAGDDAAPDPLRPDIFDASERGH